MELAIETLRSGAYDYVVKDQYAFSHIANSIEKCLHLLKLKNEFKYYKRIVLSVVGSILFILGLITATGIFAPEFFK